MNNKLFRLPPLSEPVFLNADAPVISLIIRISEEVIHWSRKASTFFFFWLRNPVLCSAATVFTLSLQSRTADSGTSFLTTHDIDTRLNKDTNVILRLQPVEEWAKWSSSQDQFPLCLFLEIAIQQQDTVDYIQTVVLCVLVSCLDTITDGGKSDDITLSPQTIIKTVDRVLYLSVFSKNTAEFLIFLIFFFRSLSWRYYLKESRGSRRWLIFLEGQYLNSSLCVHFWNDVKVKDYICCVFLHGHSQEVGTASIRRTVTADMKPWEGWWAHPSGPKPKKVSIRNMAPPCPTVNVPEKWKRIRLIRGVIKTDTKCTATWRPPAQEQSCHPLSLGCNNCNPCCNDEEEEEDVPGSARMGNDMCRCVSAGTGILSPLPEENPHWWNANMV